MTSQTAYVSRRAFPNELEALGKLCHDLAIQVKARLSQAGHQQPGFASDSPEVYPQLDDEFDQIRTQLREASKTLYELATDPEDASTRELYAKIHDANAFAIVSRFNIAEHVPVSGSVSYTDLAQKAGAGHSVLRKALRQLMTLHVFDEPEPEFVAHTAASKRLLVRGVKLNNQFLVRETLKWAAFQVDAIDLWGNDSSDPTHTPHNLAFNTDKPVFEWLREDPVRAGEFAEIMEYLFKQNSRGHVRLMNSYDWAALGDATMVDVGGSSGHCSVIVAQANPHITCIVQDLPNVVARAGDPATTIVPPGLRDRITFKEHDLLQPQEVAADVYFMRMVLHDWPDAFCEKALAHTADAMARRGPGARLLIVDSILPTAGDWPAVLERPVRVADLQMNLAHGGKERQLDEWAALFRRGHPRLAIRRVVKDATSPLAILELHLTEA